MPSELYVYEVLFFRASVLERISPEPSVARTLVVVVTSIGSVSVSSWPVLVS